MHGGLCINLTQFLTYINFIQVNREPGSMESGHSGMLIHTTEELCKIMRTAKRKGFRIECHAIGDAAVEQV